MPPQTPGTGDEWEVVSDGGSDWEVVTPDETSSSLGDVASAWAASNPNVQMARGAGRFVGKLVKGLTSLPGAVRADPKGVATSLALSPVTGLVNVASNLSQPSVYQQEPERMIEDALAVAGAGGVLKGVKSLATRAARKPLESTADMLIGHEMGRALPSRSPQSQRAAFEVIKKYGATTPEKAEQVSRNLRAQQLRALRGVRRETVPTSELGKGAQEVFTQARQETSAIPTGPREVAERMGEIWRGQPVGQRPEMPLMDVWKTQKAMDKALDTGAAAAGVTPKAWKYVRNLSPKMATEKAVRQDAARVLGERVPGWKGIQGDLGPMIDVKVALDRVAMKNPTPIDLPTLRDVAVAVNPASGFFQSYAAANAALKLLKHAGTEAGVKLSQAARQPVNLGAVGRGYGAAIPSHLSQEDTDALLAAMEGAP